MNAGLKKRIEEMAASIGKSVNHRHVAAFVYVAHGTLDALSRQELGRSIAVAISCAEEAGPKLSDQLAATFGLQ